MSQQRIRLNFGSSVLNLPKEILLDNLPMASEFSLKVLILAASDEKLLSDYDSCIDEIAKKLNRAKSDILRAVVFWRNAGVLELEDAKDDQKPSVKKTSKHLLTSVLPGYTESEAADIIASSGELKDVIALAQEMLGKVFTPADASVVVGMYDHLGLPSDYIVTLIAYCKENGKNSMRYVEKTAVNLFDEGISTTEALSAYIKRREEIDSDISGVRRLIGAQSRELTSKEKKLFTLWIEEWEYGYEVIKKAYEITIDKINEPSTAYMNKILENWHDAGLRSAEDIEASLEAYKQKKLELSAGKKSDGKQSGFETDEFFEAALARSYKRSQN